jgi:hypothetical protein
MPQAPGSQLSPNFRPDAVGRRLVGLMQRASRFCPPGWRTHAVDPSVWISLRQLARQRSYWNAHRAVRMVSDWPLYPAVPIEPQMADYLIHHELMDFFNCISDSTRRPL